LVQYLARKYSPFVLTQISSSLCRLTRQEGRLAIVTNARWDAVDAEAMTDEAGMMRTAKSCGSDAAVLASSCAGLSCAATVAKEPFTGKSTK
jgi:hypothetical protein